ncbi:MAG: hypothetical protein ACXWTR_02630 [Methylotenera sp.]
MHIREFDNHPVTLYSNLIEWLQALNMRSAPAAQWIATIVSAKGMRKDEIERSGLLSFLNEFDKTDKVAKEQLLDVAEDSLSDCLFTVRTERSISYRPALQSAAFTSETIPKKVFDTFSDGEIVSCHNLVSFNYRIVRLKFTGMFGSGESWCVFDEHWHRFKPYKNYESAVDAVDFLYTVAADRFSEYSSKAPRNYYERYSLLGKNSSYKEWVVCLPDWPEVYENSHFDLNNLVLHIRTSEWRDTKDQPLLLIDEIQSDWHALGRDNGYYDIGTIADEGSDAVPEAPFKKEWHELGIKLAIWIALQSGHRRVAFTTANVHKLRYGRNLDGFHLLYDQLIPKALAKLATKFKCTLEQGMILISIPTDSIRYKRGTGWELSKQGKNDDIQIIQNQVVAMRYLESRGQKKSEEVRVFEISPVLADMVKSKGLPLFGWW